MATQLNPGQENALREVAAIIRVDPGWLYSLISFESNWNPKARNPHSGAMGLIQFTNATARSMGYLSAQELYEKNPSVEQQLRGPVLKYLKPMGPFPTMQSLQMAVFFPAAKKVPEDTAFQDLYMKLYPDTWPTRYATFVKQNPGIVKVSDYMAYVARRSKTLGGAAPIAGILLLVGLFWLAK